MTSERCEEIKAVITDLYTDFGISTLPIDVFSVARSLQIGVRKYNSHILKEQIVLLSASADGMSYLSLSDKRYYIAYNQDMNAERVRFTIAHEIGHIMLEHKESNIITEYEADNFAQWFLVPEPVLIFNKIDCVSKVCSTFGVSASCAEVCLNKLTPRIKSYGYKIFNSEKKILVNFGYIRGVMNLIVFNKKRTL